MAVLLFKLGIDRPAAGDSPSPPTPGSSIQMGGSMGWSLARLLQAAKAFKRVIVAAGDFFYAMEALLRQS